MTDRDDIIDVINGLFIAVDGRDWRAVRHALAPDLIDMLQALQAPPGRSRHIQ